MAYKVMAYIVMAYTVMAYIVMAYIVMAHDLAEHHPERQELRSVERYAREHPGVEGVLRDLRLTKGPP